MIAKTYVKLVLWAQYLSPLVLLIVRLSWGWNSAEAGYACLNHLSQTTRFFDARHVAFPNAAAVACGSVELIAGSLLMLGLAARLGGLLLCINFLLLMLLENHDNVMRAFSQSPDKLIDSTTYPFCVASLIVLAFGPGIFSIDALLKRTIFKKHAGTLK